MVENNLANRVVWMFYTVFSCLCDGFGDGGWFGNWKCFYRPITYLTKFRVGVIFAILTLQFLCSNWESTLVNGIGLASFWIFCANFVSDILYGTCGWVWFGNWWISWYGTWNWLHHVFNFRTNFCNPFGRCLGRCQVSKLLTNWIIGPICANFVSDILYGTCGWVWWVWFGNWWCWYETCNWLACTGN